MLNKLDPLFLLYLSCEISFHLYHKYIFSFLVTIIRPVQDLKDLNSSHPILEDIFAFVFTPYFFATATAV